MENIKPRGLFPVPWLSYFLELNVRTYVKDKHGRPGVWFYSLDTNRWIAYKIARKQFSLSYFHANMSVKRENNVLDYQTIRKGETKESRMVYGADESSEWRTAEPDSLDHFLVERYRLFSYDDKKDRLFTGEVKHKPYEIREARVPVWDTQPAIWDGLMPLEGNPDHSCVAKTVHVDVFPIQTVD